MFLIKWWILVKNTITCNIVIETSLCMSLVYISFSESFHVVVALPNKFNHYYYALNEVSCTISDST